MPWYTPLPFGNQSNAAGWKQAATYTGCRGSVFHPRLHNYSLCLYVVPMCHHSVVVKGKVFDYACPSQPSTYNNLCLQLAAHGAWPGPLCTPFNQFLCG
jgi:hypothetical protein